MLHGRSLHTFYYVPWKKARKKERFSSLVAFLSDTSHFYQPWRPPFLMLLWLLWAKFGKNTPFPQYWGLLTQQQLVKTIKIKKYGVLKIHFFPWSQNFRLKGQRQRAQRGSFRWLLWPKSAKRKRLFIPQEQVHFITFLRPPDMTNQEDQYNQLWHYKKYSKN